VDKRKARFAALLEIVTQRHGWLTSVPGDTVVTMECLPGSTLPAELRAAGYDVQPDGNGQRVLAHSIVEKFVAGPDGTMQPLTAGSSQPVAQTVTHAGIVRTERHAFSLP
jgi:hypothetical protein